MNRFLYRVISVVFVSLFVPTIGTGAEKESTTGDRVFARGGIQKFHLKLSERQFAALTPAVGGRPGGPGFGPPGFGPPTPVPEGTHRNTFGVNFPWAHGDLVFEDGTFCDVAVRYKGNYTYMAAAQSLKKPLKIDLNRHVKGQKLDGLTMLNFNSGVSDPTRTREAMSYAFFRDAGLPAPRTSFVELTLSVPDRYDHELVGVFTLVEQVGKAFLEKHFQDGRGMLLKPEGLQGGLGHRGDDWKAYEAQYHPETEPTEEEQQRLIDFTRLIDRGTDKEFAAEIASYLEIDPFVRFIAANTLLANLDSYLGYGHNYYLYLVPGTKKFVFIPWDLDLSLATWPAVGTPEQLVELSIHHPHAGQNKLIERLFAIPDHKQRYLEILQELCQTVFTEEAFVTRLAEFESELKAPLAAEAKAIAGRNEGRGGGGFGGGGGQFGQSMPTRRFITLRTKSVADQLAGQAKGFEPRAFGMGFGGPPPGGRPAGRPRR